MDIFNLSFNMQESWAICRIFKKTNSTAQRALSHSWVSSLSETRTSNMLTKNQEITQFCSSNISLTKNTSLANHFYTNNNDSQNFDEDVTPYKSIISPLLHEDLNTSLIFSSSSPLETSNTNSDIISKSTMDVSSMLLNMSSSSSMLGDFSKTCDEVTTTNFMNGGLQEQFSDYSLPFGNYQYDNNALVKVPYNVNMNVPRIDEQELMNFNIGDAWKSNLLWDTSFCPIDVPSSYSTTKCYT